MKTHVRTHFILSYRGIMISNLFVVASRHGRILNFQDLNSLGPLPGVDGSFHSLGGGTEDMILFF